MGDRERAHHAYRLDSRDGLAGVLEELADGQIPPALVELAADGAHLADITGAARDRLVVRHGHLLPRERDPLQVELLEIREHPLVREPVERRQCRAFGHQPADHLFAVGHREPVDGVGGLHDPDGDARGR